MNQGMRVVSGLLGAVTMIGIVLVYFQVPEARRARLTPAQHWPFAMFFGLGALCVLKAFRPEYFTRAKKAAAQAVAASLLDTMLYWFTPKDPYRLRDVLAGGVAIMGRSGSGKSSASGFQLGRALVNIPSGGLILGSKPEDKQFWQKLFDAAGRGGDLLVFETGGALTFNPVDFELQSGADCREITQYFMSIDETLKRAKKGGGANESFWEGSKERTLYNAVVVNKLATGKIGVPELADFINGAAISAEQLNNPNWRKGMHCKYLDRAWNAEKTAAEKHDYHQAFEFWTGEWPMMEGKVRSSVLMDTMNVLHTLNSGKIRLLLSGETNVSPAVMERGKWVLVNMPVHEKGAGGLAVNAAWKYATQRYILRRHAGENTPPIIIWSDEYQNVANSFDANFLAECRSHRGAMVVLTQSIHSFYSAIAGDDKGHQAKALLSNFGLKIFHSLGDSESAAFASSLIGKAVLQRSSFSQAPAKDIREQTLGGSNVTYSSAEHTEEIIQGREFMHGLRTGGAPDYVADAIVIKAGEPFSHGGNYLKVAFSQRAET